MSHASILLVDDLRVNLIALEAILQPLGHPLISVDSGAAALKQLLLHDFAVILLDARMPVLDGYETAALIRQRERSEHTPIIFLTADASDRADMLRAYDQGAVDFLGKPFEPKILRAKVSVFVALYRQGQQLTLQAESLRQQGQAAVRAEVHAAALAKISAELVRSNRELDQFAYVASHDLKAPLRGIANLSVWIEEDLAEWMTDATREQMRLLRGRVRRMELLIDGILAYSRANRGTAPPAPVAVRALVLEQIDLLAPPADAVVRVPEVMPELVCERVPFQQVWMNLLGNAFKHARREGVVVEVSAADCGDAWEFAVKDNGPGIDPKYHTRVFGLFQTLASRDTVEGTGIGLAIVKKVVESRGGTVALESELGDGATFRFRWPKLYVSPETIADLPPRPPTS